MSNFTVRKANSFSDRETVAQLADVIWRECYASILSKEQIEYSLAKFQSLEAVERQVNSEGYVYYIASPSGEDKDVAYCAVYPNDGGCLFLSKLYVLAAYRGKGAARALIDAACDEREIFLTVNRNNVGSIEAYKRMGFEIYGKQVADIGGGFFMDDYCMRRVL